MYNLSIITINKNNKNGLNKTIESVIIQNFKNFEFIVIDGDSEDGSGLILDKYKSNIDITISEQDSGIYDAMNKGLAKAKGEYILFLNSGDMLYAPNVLQELFNEISGEDYFYGNVALMNDAQEIKILPSAETIYFADRYQHNLPMQPVFFAKKKLLQQFGGFDEQYKIIADVALIAKICSSNAKYKFINIPVTLFDTSGISSQQKNQAKIYRERQHFLKSNFPQYLEDFEHLYKRNFLKSVLNKLKSWF
jgi:glycosyltransferase involved in cell wall biosynthesis